ASGDAGVAGPSDALLWWWTIQRAAFAWVALVGVELWLARPLGRLYAEPLLYWTWPAVNLVRIVLSPAIGLERAADALVRQMTGSPAAVVHNPIQEEILTVVNEGEREGKILVENAADMIEGLMAMHEVVVSEIMKPRTDMVMLKASDSIEEARRVIVHSGHSRIPVYEESRDEVCGVLYAKDLLPYLNAEEDVPSCLAEMPLRRPVYVPETKPVDVLLREFQRERIHIAIILDEYGGVAGLATIEDILEEIVGEIDDEYDPTVLPSIQRLDANRVEVDGRVHVDEVNELVDLRLPEDGDFDTIGGFVFNTLGRIPKPGETLEYGDAVLTILEASPRTIHRLRIEARVKATGGAGVQSTESPG
ncbi:MAG: hemolysin family protein, partial [Planctomycetia bacterium]